MYSTSSTDPRGEIIQVRLVLLPQLQRPPFPKIRLVAAYVEDVALARRVRGCRPGRGFPHRADGVNVGSKHALAPELVCFER